MKTLTILTPLILAIGLIYGTILVIETSIQANDLRRCLQYEEIVQTTNAQWTPMMEEMCK